VPNVLTVVNEQVSTGEEQYQPLGDPTSKRRSRDRESHVIRLLEQD
jgi:hypothetical protein